METQYRAHFRKLLSHELSCKGTLNYRLPQADNTVYTLTARSPANGIKKVSLNPIADFRSSSATQPYLCDVVLRTTISAVCCIFESLSQGAARLKVSRRVLQI